MKRIITVSFCIIIQFVILLIDGYIPNNLHLKERFPTNFTPRKSVRALSHQSEVLLVDLLDKIPELKKAGIPSEIFDSSTINLFFRNIFDESSESKKIIQHQFEILFSADTLHNIDTLFSDIANNPWSLPMWTVFVVALIIGGVGSDDGSVGGPYSVGTAVYDYQKSSDYYDKRPFFVFRRLFRLARLTSSFNLKLAYDYFSNSVDENMSLRSKEALTLITQLGPTFIKLGQALSIRTDLIPEPYALELRKLQDAVPPFPTEKAKEIIRKELGVSNIDEIFESISEKPIAAASIGQVYRATLKDKREVAVKVQRPRIVDEIALDLYILRLLTPLQVRLSNAISKRKTSQGDLDVVLRLVDEWGRGFIAEVDYKLEAKNGKSFCLAMEKRGLNAVTAPEVIEEISGERVLVTRWMDGTRLDKDASLDVPRLCGVAVNAYLTMLLDTGVLHCDPHPGNLLRTKDGRLCILDWGMTLTVPKELQYALLEFIAHINTENYESIPRDFINLGFSPPNSEEKLKSSGLTEGIAFTFRQLSKGGGPKKIQERFKEEFRERYGNDLTDEELRMKAREEMMNKMQQQLREEGVNVNGVTEVMEQMSRRNRELFKLPPYVLYVSRAFSTLEGIGLTIDENYSIIQECYPYLARRLFTDNSPRAKQALREMLFGGRATSIDGDNNTVLSPKKLIEMTTGFSTYTSSTVEVDQRGKGSKVAQDALVDIVLAPEGSAVQDILIEALTKVTDALVREGISKSRNTSTSKSIESFLKFTSDTTKQIIPIPLQPLATPFLLPYQLSQTLAKFGEKNAEDVTSLRTLESLLYFIGSSGSDIDSRSEGLNKSDIGIQSAAKFLMSQMSQPNSDVRKLVQDPKLQEKFPVLLMLSRKYGSSVLKRVADRVEKVAASHHSDSSNSKRRKFTTLSKSTKASPSNSDDELLRAVGDIFTKSARTLAEALEPSSKIKL